MRRLIDKFLKNTLSDIESEKLKMWLVRKKNQKKFKNYLNDQIDVNILLQNSDASKTYNTIAKKIDKPKGNLRQLSAKFLKYAALIVVLLSINYTYQHFFNIDEEVVIDKEAITLQLENGEIKVLNAEGEHKILGAKGIVISEQNGSKLTYSENTETEKIVYNTLTVPYGKRFEVNLSDGSMVHLNSGTILKYPIKFIAGHDRQVFLNGEAFFDIAKDSKHPFIVNANQLNVRVLGTQFNITSYPEDENINTVLLEGAVSFYKTEDVYDKKSSLVLKPGELVSLHKENGKLSVKETDVEMYTAWRKGRLILDEVAFTDILKKLERQYNVKFINNDKSLDNRFFTATFDVEDIKQVMRSLSSSASFEYMFSEDLIIINP